MKNHFNFAFRGERVLITNDFGYYCYLSYQEFKDLLNDKIDHCTEKWRELVQKKFVADGDIEVFIENSFLALKAMKLYLYKSPSLHIFVVTTQCNSDCIYCQAHSNNTSCCITMNNETAEKAVDIALSAPEKHLSFEFQGGEPLINFAVIKHIIEYTEYIKKDKEIVFSIVSNLTLLTDEMIVFFKRYNVCFSTSLDGHKFLHDINRPMKARNKSMYELTISGIKRLKSNGCPVGAIQTTTRFSLDKSVEIIREYIERGMNHIFIRPLTPLGMAYDKWDQIGYTADEFLAFYKECLEYIIDINKHGYKMAEGHAMIFLSKILYQNAVNYMELRSPCGGGIGQIAYYPDGDIYTCDEARMLADMGDKAFRMGNVFSDSYNSIMHSTACKAVCKSSILETIPSCCDCVYQPYCGVCPVINYAFGSSVYENEPHNYRCRIYKGMLNCLFDLLEDKDTRKVFEEWLSYE